MKCGLLTIYDIKKFECLKKVINKSFIKKDLSL